MIKHITTGLVSGVMAFAFSATASAQTSISPAEREAAVAALAQVIEDEFFDAERATQIAEDLRSASADGAFAAANEAEALASALTERLSEEDRHFGVTYAGLEAVAAANAPRESRPGPSGGDRWAGLRRQNFGFANVEILPGNIGYIDLRMFSPIEPAEATARAALDFVAGTEAVIFDVRQNGGGAPSMVQYLVSHFVDPGGQTLINTFVSRDYEYPNQMWSLPSHPSGHRTDVPLYVLTSGRTGSAGEAFPYHLKALERATVIGETTYGAGNPGETFLVDEGFSIFVSTGSARNPITDTNWEGTGVTPHIDVDADRALDAALTHAYAHLLDGDPDAGSRQTLEWALEALEAGAEPVNLSDADIARYAGAYGIRSFHGENGRMMYSRDGAPAVALEALGNHRFRLPDDNGARFVFVADSPGPASRLDLHIADGRVMRNNRTD